MAKAFIGLDPRDEAFERLHESVQSTISLISGLPPSGVLPAFEWTRRRIACCIVLWVVIGISLSLFSISLIFEGRVWGAIVLVPALLLTVGGFRAAMTTLLHDIVHRLEPHCKRNTREVYRYVLGWMGELITICLLLPSLSAYYRDHVLLHHSGRTFCTLRDPDAGFLYSLGLKPGSTKRACWRRFIWLLLWPLSPLYIRFTLARARAQLHPLRLAIVIAFWTTLLCTASELGMLIPFCVVYGLASGIGVPAAALAQFSSEHCWLLVRRDKDRRQYLRRTCRGRVFLDSCPPATARLPLRLSMWTLWWMRLLFIHVPLRVTVCPFDLGSGHDLHHFGEDALRKGKNAPSWATWTNAGHFRRWVELQSDRGTSLTTYYGLGKALDSVFENYAALDPLDPELASIQQRTGTELILEM